MENTCKELLDHCLRDEDWSPDLLNRALQLNQGRELLSAVVEPLGDRFDTRLCDTYVRLFSEVIERMLLGHKADEIRARYRRIRRPGAPPAWADRIYVLSRVTLGADVAVTSVMLDAVKRAYPNAEILFVGPRKNYELFEADERIRHFPASYARAGTLAERLRASVSLREKLTGGIVVDPDSRLSQLGLIPVCDEPNYFFFESRSFGGNGTESLPVLAARWARDVFGVSKPAAYIAPLPRCEPPPDITVSFGVGANSDKRVGEDFEVELLRMLAATGTSVLVDKGGSIDEHELVDRLVSQCDAPNVRTHEGAFAPFAAAIAGSRLYVGYDSAGQHVAAACGIPLISIFGGFASERTFQRWRPKGTVIRTDQPDVLEEVRRAIAVLGPMPDIA